jgi:hypothetical protein
MERLLRFTERKYADSGGRWEVSFGADSRVGADGVSQDPRERDEKSMGKPVKNMNSANWYRLLGRPLRL